MEIALKDGERIDSLHKGGYSIVQNKKSFCFGMDAVLLAHFACKNIEASKVQSKPVKILDLCTGNGIVPLLMNAAFSEASEESLDGFDAEFSALELQNESFDMARRSVQLNSLESKISVLQGDVKTIGSYFNQSSFDFVTCNPPYMIPSKGRQSQNMAKMIARQEICCNIMDVIKAALYCMKENGHFFMIHRPERLDEILKDLQESGLKAAEIQLVKAFEDKAASMVLLHCVLAHNSEAGECSILPPLVIYRKAGEYTSEAEAIYGRKA